MFKKVILITEENYEELALTYQRDNDYFEEWVGMKLVTDFGDGLDFDVLSESLLQDKFEFVGGLENGYENFVSKDAL